MTRAIALLGGLLLVGPLFAACGGDAGQRTAAPPPAPVRFSPTGGTPILSTPPAPTGPASEPPGESAVYLSLGDSIQYGCCRPQDPQLSAHPVFARYLAQRLNRPVEWVTLAGNDTTNEFINGVGDAKPPQLDRAVALLQEYRRRGRPVVAITLSIGGNDLLEHGRVCQAQGGPPCLDLFTDLLERYSRQSYLILTRLNEAKDPHTPVLQLNVYNPYDCGQPGVEISPEDLGVRIFNGRIEGGVMRNGAFLVDIYTPFRGKACEDIRDVDPTYEGYAVIAQKYERVYETLPPEFVEPFLVSSPTP